MSDNNKKSPPTVKSGVAKSGPALLIGFTLGLVMSLFVMGLAFKIAAPTIFFKQISSEYDFDKTVNLIASRIDKLDGWTVTQILDQQKAVIKNGGKDPGKVKIIKFCNGKLSGRMLSEDQSKYMAAKMPLSIAVFEKSDGRVTIGMMNGYVLSRLFSGTREGEIMELVVRDIEKALGFVHFKYSIF